MIIHHIAAEREFACDRESSIGKAAKGSDEAPRRGWSVASMKDDWKAVYPD
jgi:hypothetical protein